MKPLDFALKLLARSKGDQVKADRVLASGMTHDEMYKAIIALADEAEAQSTKAYEVEWFKRYPEPIYLGQGWDE